MLDLGTLGGFYSRGVAINASGQVTGTPTRPTGPVTPSCGTARRCWTSARWGATVVRASAINDSGQVAGSSETGVESIHAFLWDGTTMVDLGTLGGCLAFGRAINASGQVTGFAERDRRCPDHAFLWDGTTLQDLNALIDPADPLQPFVTLFDGVDINDLGQILANGFDSRTGGFRAYLLSPILRCPNPARSRCSASASRVSALRDDAEPRKRHAQRSEEPGPRAGSRYAAT